jgi:hypothetical protein
MAVAIQYYVRYLYGNKPLLGDLCSPSVSDGPMTKHMQLVAPALAILLSAQMLMESVRFHALVFYSTTVESDHLQFAKDALAFFHSTASKDQFEINETTNWDDLNDTNLRKYQLVV